MVDVHPGVRISNLAVLTNADLSLRIDQIQATPPEAFGKVPEGQIRVSDPTWARSIWLKITLRAHEPVANQTPSAASILEIQKPYLDEVALYTPSAHARGGWQVQRAGDSIPKSDWSLPGQFPRFVLPVVSDLLALPEGQMVVYLHVPHRMPASFDLKVRSDTDLMEDIQRDHLLLGLTFGCILLATLLSIALFAYHRDSLFVWNALYAAAALLASASHSGLAFQYLWPWGGMWPSNAVLFFALIGSAAQLQFCKLMFAPTTSRTWHVALCDWLGVVALVSAVAITFVNRDGWLIAIFASQGAIVAGMLVSSTLIVQACWRGNKFAIASALTYLPLFIAVVIVMANAQGFIGLPEFGYNAPLYAVAVEVALLALCLLWFGHERHGQLERKRALAATDSLTGFSTADAFHNRLLQDWQSADAQRKDLAVAFVELQTKGISREHSDQLLMRSVRILRSATRSQDMVARLDGQLIAIIMPNIRIGDELNQILSRIVALGLIPDRGDPQATTLQFRIAATTRWQLREPVANVEPRLRQLLSEPEGWSNRPIRLVKQVTKTPPGSPKMIDSGDLEALWAQALEAANHKTPQKTSDGEKPRR
ncbi:MAG: 7TM diverse intracellular signaling domain-containing protein [Brachymonas sp.]